MKKGTILVTTIILFGIITTVNAASFEFVPASNTYSTCHNSIDIMLDPMLQTVNSADIEILFDNTKVQIIDSNPSIDGIQIIQGDAFQSYWGNITYQNQGRILLAGGSVPNKNDVLITKKLFGRIEYNYIGNKNDSTTFQIVFNGIGNTLDSNIASSIDGSDLLDSVINGTYTFTVGGQCKTSSSHSSAITATTILTPSVSPIPTVNVTPTINLTPTIKQPLNPEEILHEENKQYMHFIEPIQPPRLIVTEYGTKISQISIFSCLLIQFIILFFLLWNRRQIRRDIETKATLYKTIIKEINKKGLIKLDR